MVFNVCGESVFYSKDPISENPNFRNMIGALDFMARLTLLDIKTTVGILSQFSAKPTNFVLHVVNRVFAYLKSTCDFGLDIPLKSSMQKFKFYSDSDFATD